MTKQEETIGKLLEERTNSPVEWKQKVLDQWVPNRPEDMRDGVSTAIGGNKKEVVTLQVIASLLLVAQLLLAKRMHTLRGR